MKKGNFSGFVDFLSQFLEDCGGHSVAILVDAESRTQQHIRKSTDLPILDVFEDREDDEICLLTKGLTSPEGPSPTDRLTFQEFYRKLSCFSSKCRDHVLVLSEEDRADDYVFRLDMPIQRLQVHVSDLENTVRLCVVTTEA